MGFITVVAAAARLSAGVRGQQAPPITTAGQPARLDIRVAGQNSLRVTLKPASFTADFPATPAVVDRSGPAPANQSPVAHRTDRAAA